MKLTQLIKEVFNVSDQDLKDDTKLTQLKEWDSMTHMLFITRLEEEYNIALDGEEIASMNAVGDIKRIIEKKGKSLEQ